MPIKPPGPILGAGAVRIIERAVAEVFIRAKARILGPQSVAKRIAIGLPHEFTLPGLYELASREEGVKPDVHTLAQVLKIAGGYIDATAARTQARVVKEVTSFLHEAHAAGVKTDLKTVLGGKLTEVFSQAVVSMRRIIDTEANNVKNVGILDGILRINAASGIEDPVVYWVGVLDKDRCEECWRLFTLEDRITPKVYKMSEVGHSYHKKGENQPKLGGLHPNCFTDSRTPVLTEKGWKGLSRISVGERVLTHLGHFKKVLAVVDAEYSKQTTVAIKYDYLGSEQNLIVTPDHKFLTGRGWVEARQLTTEDTLIPLKIPSDHNGLYSFGQTKIKNVAYKQSGQQGRAYCLTVEDDESFVSRGVVSHNCRDTIASIVTGYGFKNGRVAYIGKDHDEYARQRGMEKAEPKLVVEHLEKG